MYTQRWRFAPPCGVLEYQPLLASTAGHEPAHEITMDFESCTHSVGDSHLPAVFSSTNPYTGVYIYLGTEHDTHTINVWTLSTYIYIPDQVPCSRPCSVYVPRRIIHNIIWTRGQVYVTKTGTGAATLYAYWQEQVLAPAGDALCSGILTSSTSETPLRDCLSALTRQVSHRGPNFAG